jgi:hypothetical protein
VQHGRSRTCSIEPEAIVGAAGWTDAGGSGRIDAMAKPPPPKPPSGLSPPATGAAERCAFCGRREIEAGRLIAGAKAAICADCIRRLGEGLRGGRPPKK